MIQFENIRTGEVVKFDGTQDPNTRQAHIAAFLNSSDMSPNALKGQDFGWRLAPEIKDEIERIKTDLPTLDMLSKRVGVPVDELRDFHILNFIAEQDFAQQALAARAQADSPAYQESYEARLKALRERREQPVVQPVQTTTEAPVTTTTVAPEPVTTTTEAPVTTTTVADELDLGDAEDEVTDETTTTTTE